MNRETQNISLYRFIHIVSFRKNLYAMHTDVYLRQAHSQSRRIGICVGMKEANRAIQRERHTTPILDDAPSNLSRAIIFSAFDLNHFYHPA